MKNRKGLEQDIKNHLLEQWSQCQTGDGLDRRVHEAIERARTTPLTHMSPSNKRSSVMRNSLIRTAAAITLVAAALSLWMMNQFAGPAYAIGDTLDAMETIRTVHFRAELFRQGNIECWMQFEKGVEKPTHLCLFTAGHPLRKVDTPDGSFAYNEQTNRFRKVCRDERRQDWYPDFTEFFKSALERAEKSNHVIIAREPDPFTGEDAVTIMLADEHRDWKAWIDPATKLPYRLETLNVRDIMALLEPTILVKTMSPISYNEPLPSDLFTIPEDATEVVEEIDVIVHSGMGMPVGDLTRPEACRILMQQVVEAMNAFDFATVKKLYLPFMAPPAEILKPIKIATSQTGEPVLEILEMGEPYQQGPYWYLPCTAREVGGKIKTDPVRIRFYEIDGVEYCIVAMPNL